MSDDVTALRKEFEKFKNQATKEIEAQAKAVRELQNKVKSLEGEHGKLVTYVNNLMKKAENLILSKFAQLRRTQVIDRQKLNDLDSEVGRISRQNK